MSKSIIGQSLYLFPGDVSGEDFAARMRAYYDSTKLQICAAAAEKYIKTISADMKGNAHIVYNF